MPYTRPSVVAAYPYHGVRSAAGPSPAEAFEADHPQRRERARGRLGWVALVAVSDRQPPRPAAHSIAGCCDRSIANRIVPQRTQFRTFRQSCGADRLRLTMWSAMRAPVLRAEAPALGTASKPEPLETAGYGFGVAVGGVTAFCTMEWIWS